MPHDAHFKAMTPPAHCLQLYRRSLKLIKAHEHDVDTATPLDPGRVIRDITATFTLGLTSQTAQTLTFRCAMQQALRRTSCCDLLSTAYGPCHHSQPMPASAVESMYASCSFFYAIQVVLPAHQATSPHAPPPRRPRRCVNDAEEGTDTIDTYMDWCTSEYRPAEQVEHAARPSTSAADEPVDVPDQQQPEQQPDAAAADQPAAAENPAPMDTAGFTAAPALPAAPAPATLPGPPRRGLTPSRSLGNLQHSSGGSGAQPVPLFMLEMEAEETVTLLSRRYNTVEWHKPAFEELRRKAGLADVDRQPVMHFVRQLGLLVLELVAAELGDVDERGLGLGLSVADFEHLVRPLYG